MQLQTYLFFDGRCDEAVEFYQAAIGAKVDVLLRFKDGPPPGDGGCSPGMAPGSENKVMHGVLRIGDATVLVSDGLCGGAPNFAGFSLAVTAATNEEAEQQFAALAEGGRIDQPLAETFFTSRFGMLTDKFGVHWMVTVVQAASQTAA